MLSRGRRVDRTVLRIVDLGREAGVSIGARPSRAVAVSFGVVVGVVALVTTVGLASTLRAQVGETFDLLSATEVVVEVGAVDGPAPAGSDADTADVDLVPPDYRARLARLPGVESAGLVYDLAVAEEQLRSGLALRDPTTTATVVAAAPEAFDVVEPSLARGRVYDEAHERRADRVMVVGRPVAESLGIRDVVNRPTVFVGDRPFTVIGIVDDVRRHPELLLSAVIPPSTALADLGPVVAAEPRILVETAPGAAGVVADNAPLALRADRPEVVHATAPPDPQRLSQELDANLARLLVGLAALSLLLGGFGIASVVHVAVMQRVPEIGVRRAVGARPPHIAAQFLAEAMILGTLGGVVGASSAVLVTVGVAAANGWTTVMNVGLVSVSPLLGTLTGLLAGIYPAWRATTIEPVEALRA